VSEASRVKTIRHSYRCKCSNEGEVRFDVYLPAGTDQTDIDNIECPVCKQDIFLSRVSTAAADASADVRLRYYFVFLLIVLFSSLLGLPSFLIYRVFYGP